MGDALLQIVHEKNDFAKVSKNLAIDWKIISLDYQNCYVASYIIIILMVHQNYFQICI